MLLLDARREARVRDGDLVLLADQDRSLWDTAQIARGRAVLDRALALQGPGPYVVQAAIASLHAEGSPDWPRIAALYGELSRLTNSPIVELNRAIAVAEAEGPAAALELVDRLPLDDYHYLHATRGELLRRLGNPAEARDAYRRALALVHDDAERRLLQRRCRSASRRRSPLERLDAGEGAQQRRLAGAVGGHHADAGAGRNGEADTVENKVLAEGDRDFAGDEGGGHPPILALTRSCSRWSCAPPLRFGCSLMCGSGRTWE